MMKIVGIGEALWDVFPDGKKIGGAPANFAYHAAQFGVEGIAVSAVGKDDLGDEIVSTFDEAGLDYRLERVDYPTGTVQVELDEAGIPSYIIKEGAAWDNIPFTDGIKALARNCDAVCFGSLAQRSEVSRRTINEFIDTMPGNSLKIFDINLRQHFYTEEIIRTSLRKANILKINDEEVIKVADMLHCGVSSMEDICRFLLREFDLKMVILTRGAVGSNVFTEDKMSWIETPKVDVVSTVGAGDSFTGAFIAAILKGADIRTAHRLAVDVSAFVCTRTGAMPQIPENLKGRI